MADQREEVDQEACSFGYAEQHDGAEEAEEVRVVVLADAGVQEAAVVVESFHTVVADSVVISGYLQCDALSGRHTRQVVHFFFLWSKISRVFPSTLCLVRSRSSWRNCLLGMIPGSLLDEARATQKS